MIVVGDVTLEDIKPRLERLFGGWQRGDVPAYKPPAAPQSRRQVILVDKPGAAQSEIRIGLVGVDRATPDYYALSVMNTILGGSFSSRLNQKLREEKQYTYGARSSFSFGMMPGPFTASAGVQTAVTDSALYEFMRELNGIREPVPEDELDRARNYVALRFPGAFQAVGQIANQLEDLYLYDLPLDYFNGYVQGVLARHAGRRAARGAAVPRAEPHGDRGGGRPEQGGGGDPGAQTRRRHGEEHPGRAGAGAGGGIGVVRSSGDK